MGGLIFVQVHPDVSFFSGTNQTFIKGRESEVVWIKGWKKGLIVLRFSNVIIFGGGNSDKLIKNQSIMHSEAINILVCRSTFRAQKISSRLEFLSCSEFSIIKPRLQWHQMSFETSLMHPIGTLYFLFSVRACLHWNVCYWHTFQCRQALRQWMHEISFIRYLIPLTRFSVTEA